MSESWERRHRRYRLVDDVLDDAIRTGVQAVCRHHDAIAAEYGTEGLGGFLIDVQRRWHRAFEARLDVVLESGDGDPATAVGALWQTLAHTLPGTRLVLDAYADHPALTGAEARHRAMLRAATGVDLPASRCPEPKIA
jgi:hypothetical protein